MSSLAKTLRTDALGDLNLKGVAQVLRKKGRGKDTILAHITPEEARLLKARGGRGSINPNTGLPEFEGGDTSGDFINAEMPMEQIQQQGQTPSLAGATVVQAPDYTQQAPGGAIQPTTPQYDYFNQPGISSPPPQEIPVSTPSGTAPAQAPVAQGGAAAAPTVAPTGTPAAAPGALQVGPPQGVSIYGEQPGPPSPAQPPQQSWLARNIGIDDSTLSTLGKLGLGGVGGLLGLNQAKALQKQGQTAANQIQALGTPFQQQGADLIAQAGAGQMSAASMQAYQAAQAQLAQNVARTGGVGANQAASALEQLRMSLLDNQYQLGLQVSGIGNQYALQAIQQGLQSNQQAAQLGQNYFSALARVLGGGGNVFGTTAGATQ